MNEINVTLRGVVGTDVDYYAEADKKPFARFRMAVVEKHRNQEGNWSDGTPEWFTVKAFGKLAENISSSLSKGDQIIAVGVLRTEPWVAKNGMEHTSLVLTCNAIGSDLNYGVAVLDKTNTHCNVAVYDATTRESAAYTVPQPMRDPMEQENAIPVDQWEILPDVGKKPPVQTTPTQLPVVTPSSNNRGRVNAL